MSRLPTFFVHLSAFLRPSRLKPDLKVPSIAHIDFRGLRKKGFNGVVIDKDNCITWPESDDIWPPYETAWNDLLAAFPPGRVLIVSNSAGTRKDPGLIAAESVSLSLRTPVLLHQTPKPGCASDLIRYFRGNLGKPTTLRGLIHSEAEKLIEAEREDENVILERWLKQVDEEPLFGPLVDEDGNRIEAKTEGRSLENRMVDSQFEASKAKTEAREQEKVDEGVEQKKRDDEELRLLIVGDRLFTDTLLAHRLSLLLRPDTKSDSAQSEHNIPSVLSVHTTSLPQPKDVRFIRWVEERLTRGKIKSGQVDWGRYIRDPNRPHPDSPHADDVRPTLIGRWRLLKREIAESRLQWDPRTWTALDLAVGLGGSVAWGGRGVWRGVSNGGRYIWGRTRRKGSEEAGGLAAVQGEQPSAVEKATS